MNEPTYILDSGTKIVTDKRLGSTSGIFVRPQYIEARRPSAKGVIKNWVAGHGGDIYWVEHEDGAIAVYGWMEFEFDTGQLDLPFPTGEVHAPAQGG